MSGLDEFRSDGTVFVDEYVDGFDGPALCYVLKVFWRDAGYWDYPGKELDGFHRLVATRRHLVVGGYEEVLHALRRDLSADSGFVFPGYMVGEYALWDVSERGWLQMNDGKWPVGSLALDRLVFAVRAPIEGLYDVVADTVEEKIGSVDE